jgi:hypothetical protein
MVLRVGGNSSKSYTAPVNRRADMGWRLASLALAWVAGVAAQLQQSALWAAPIYVGAVGVGVVGLLLAIRWPRAFAAGILGAALLGLGSSAGAPRYASPTLCLRLSKTAKFK